MLSSMLFRADSIILLTTKYYLWKFTDCLSTDASAVLLFQLVRCHLRDKRSDNRRQVGLFCHQGWSTALSIDIRAYIEETLIYFDSISLNPSSIFHEYPTQRALVHGDCLLSCQLCCFKMFSPTHLNLEIRGTHHLEPTDVRVKCYCALSMSFHSAIWLSIDIRLQLCRLYASVCW